MFRSNKTSIQVNQWCFLLAFLLLLSIVSFSSFAQSREGERGIKGHFRSLEGNEFPVKKNVQEIRNLPKVEDQGYSSLCVGFASKYLMQHFSCSGRPGENCATLPDTRTISVLFAHSDYFGLDIYGSRSALHQLTDAAGHKRGLFWSESCRPFKRLISKIRTQEQWDSSLARIRANFLSHAAAGSTQTEEQLRRDLTATFDFDLPERYFQVALQQKKMNAFMYSSIVQSECEDFVQLPKFKVFSFPISTLEEATAKAQRTVSYFQIIDKGVELLKMGHPFILDGTCPYTKIDSGECVGRHSVAVVGYRQQCAADGSRCRDVFKLHNSWGIKWQDAHDDGWVDAKTMLWESDAPNPYLVLWIEKR